MKTVKETRNQQTGKNKGLRQTYGVKQGSETHTINMMEEIRAESRGEQTGKPINCSTEQGIQDRAGRYTGEI